MHRLIKLIVGIGFGSLLVSGVIVSEKTPQASEELIADAPLGEPPLSTRIDYEDRFSTTGFGSLGLTADPAGHEIRVDILLGAAHGQERWSDCERVRFTIDGDMHEFPGQYNGVSMRSGVYDSIRSRLTISEVRAMSRAQQVDLEICDDRVAISPARLRSLQAFVRDFEDLASDDGPSLPQPPLDLDFSEHPAFRHEIQIPLPA